MQSSKLKFKIIFIAIIFCGFFGLAKSSQAAVLFQDDFEYSSDCTGEQVGIPLRPDCFQLPGWKWSKTNYNAVNGTFSISFITST